MNEHATLDELDPPGWGPPEYDSYLVRTCHELRKKPLSQFTVEDLRIMIWRQHPEQARRLRSLIDSVHTEDDDLLDEDLLAALDAFRSSQP